MPLTAIKLYEQFRELSTCLWVTVKFTQTDLDLGIYNSRGNCLLFERQAKHTGQPTTLETRTSRKDGEFHLHLHLHLKLQLDVIFSISLTTNKNPGHSKKKKNHKNILKGRDYEGVMRGIFAAMKQLCRLIASVVTPTSPYDSNGMEFVLISCG